MPSVEPSDGRIPDGHGSPHENSGPPPSEQTLSHDSPDPDRQLIPGDRIEHGEPIDMPTVREFTQNDTINKFLLNSFLQRINDNSTAQGGSESGNGDGVGEDQEQDFES